MLTKILMGSTAMFAAAAFWFFTDATLTKHALENQRELTAAWEHVAEAQERIQVRERNIERTSRQATRAIQEAPNAHTLVPSDVATAWAAGIDSVRNAGSNAEHTDDVQGPRDRTPKRNEFGSGPASIILERSRGDVLEMQRKVGRDNSTKQR